jgi:putative FmdB family regulatory protein
MPIYAYRCDACGHTKDVLQKVSDPLLTVCPSCGAAAFQKQVTAAGFQLKGSGWYVTDFRGGDSKKAPADKDAPANGDAAKADAKPVEAGGAKADAAPAPAAPSSSTTTDKPAVAPASPPAAGGAGT